jgi:hypothetical protein
MATDGPDNELPHENIVVNHTGTDDARSKDAFATARRQVDALAA